tara:strand:+ start:257 stop:595 length:339 start_codon:yes stop_codon:yes gene_type:complete
MSDEAIEAFVCGDGEHHWVSSHEPHAPLWIIKCSQCGRHDFTEMLAAHDREVAAKAAKQALRVLADELVGGSSLLWYGRKAIPREELVDMLRNDNASLIASIKPFQKGAKRG